MKKALYLGIFAFFFLLVPSAFAVQATSPLTIISPVEGTWANKQPLIVEVPSGYEVYYSLSGSNPLDFGFIYDAPVLIDQEGEVHVRLVTVDAKGTVYEDTVNYSVVPSDTAFTVDLSVPLVIFKPGDSLQIPEHYVFELGNSGQEETGVITMEGSTFPQRYLPCVVKNQENQYRFVIKTQGDYGVSLPDEESSALYEKSQPPFVIDNWSYVQFTDKKVIFSLDNDFWQAPGSSVYIDRSKNNTIYWQSVDYKTSNPVYSFTIPAKPEFIQQYKGNKAVVLEVGEGYTLRPTGSDMMPEKSLCIDAFPGEELELDFSVDVFYENVYQGVFPLHILVDKKLPPEPKILPKVPDFFSRDTVSVSFEGDRECQLYYSVEEFPGYFKGTDEIPAAKQDKILSKSELTDFTLYEDGSVLLEPMTNEAVLYRVKAVNVDAGGNISAVSHYDVVIDPFSYYISTQSVQTKDADGSATKPFTSVKQLVDVINERDFTRVYVDGMFVISEKMDIISDCEFYGRSSRSGFFLFPDASIHVGNKAKVTFDNCVFEHQILQNNQSMQEYLFYINTSSVVFDNCELITNFSKNGILIKSDNSCLEILNTGITLQTESYGAILSGTGTSVNSSNSRYTVVAPTAVVFSLVGGDFGLTQSICSVFSDLGRIAELNSVTFSVTDNFFKYEGRKTVAGDKKTTAYEQPEAIWADKNCTVLKNSGNTVSGFPRS